MTNGADKRTGIGISYEALTRPSMLNIFIIVIDGLEKRHPLIFWDDGGWIFCRCSFSL